MNEPNPPIKVMLLGKEYPVVCAKDEEHELLLAARLLDEKMRKIRETGRVIGTERIAVMAALNIAHELIQAQSQARQVSGGVGERIADMHRKIDDAMGAE